MKAKELFEWIDEQSRLNNGVWVVVNGGGISFVDGGVHLETDLREYDEDATLLKKGEEYEDFKSTMKEEEYNSSKFYLIKHKTPYNTENVDIQVAYYE